VHSSPERFNDISRYKFIGRWYLSFIQRRPVKVFLVLKLILMSSALPKQPIKVTSTLLKDEERSKLINVLEKIAPTAVYTGDLTSSVSILITNPAGSSDWLRSRKYQYVVQFRPDVSIITLETVLAFYKLWLDGSASGDWIDKNGISITLDSQKPFDGLLISVSRLKVRGDAFIQKIKRVIERGGGKVTESLSNHSDVLVTDDPNGRRYLTAKEWGIPVVSPDWCFDSAERHAALAFKYYELVKKCGKGRRVDACNWESVMKWKKKRMDDEQLRLARRKRPLKEDGTGDEEKELKVARLDFQDTLWNSIMKDSQVSSLSQVDGDYDDNWGPEQKVIISTQTSSNASGSNPSTLMSTQKELQEEIKKSEEIFSSLFRNLSFALYGFNSRQEETLKIILKVYGANIVKLGGSSNTPDYVIFFSELDHKVANIQDSSSRVITEYAIERCIYFRSIDCLKEETYWVNPIFIDSSATIESFRENFSLPQGGKVAIAITGFKEIDLSQYQRILTKKLFNFVDFNETFTKQCDLLVIADIHGLNTLKKIRIAKLWDVHMISLRNFWRLLDQLTE